jgi:hypothetical protein
MDSVVQWLQVSIMSQMTLQHPSYALMVPIQLLRERVNRVREWIGVAVSPGRGIVPTNLETLGCAFSGWAADIVYTYQFYVVIFMRKKLQDF